MSKKHLNTDAIANELTGQSLFFAQSSQSSPNNEHPPTSPEISPQVPTESRETTPEQANARTGEQAHGRTRERANRRTSERRITRQSYNVYEDQHQALKRLEARSALSGKKPIPLSGMVRQALDDFLNKPRS